MHADFSAGAVADARPPASSAARPGFRHIELRRFAPPTGADARRNLRRGSHSHT
jgi:hypothetical protein